jgi:hypothetical protein
MTIGMELAQAGASYVVNSMVLETHRQHQRSYWLAGQNPIAAEFKTISDIYNMILKGMNSVFPRVGITVVQNENTFEHLRLEWQKERGATSSITTMAMCPSYQSIIAIGPAVIPLILRQMESEGDEPDMWFWALRVLTKADPISDDDRGDIVKMTQTWLDWARGRYVW